MAESKSDSALPSATRIQGLESLGTVWTEFTPLANQYNAANLGQGFPSSDTTPAFAKKFASEAVEQDHNQYARSYGHLPLVQQLAKNYSVKLSQVLDAKTNFLVTNGASGALYLVCQALINPGDGIVVFEPFFDFYIPPAAMAGAEVQYVSLEYEVSSNKWIFQIENVRKALKALKRPKMIVINTPHNPTGKVFSLKELEDIAKVLEEFPEVIVVADEVYEHLTFGSHSHHHFAALPGMFERTLTISSAGKTFSVTGWKVGWICAPARYITALHALHQFIVFSVCTPMQHAVSQCLELSEKPYEGFATYYKFLLNQYESKRQILVQGLRDSGLVPIEPEGSFFVVADCAGIKLPQKYEDMILQSKLPRDWVLCRFLIMEVGVGAIPLSPFFSKDSYKADSCLIRFAFCKSEDLIRKGVENLSKLSQFR
jgi:kynurenine--oxoglutarate transaminase/cysteine-S-conjugate beta-lyase/glutamine--phenylpyruvate transaminase